MGFILAQAVGNFEIDQTVPDLCIQVLVLGLRVFPEQPLGAGEGAVDIAGHVYRAMQV